MNENTSAARRRMVQTQIAARGIRDPAVLTTGRERAFTFFRFKHEPLRLVACMKELGWGPVDGWRYGEEPGARLLYLFRRRET